MWRKMIFTFVIFLLFMNVYGNSIQNRNLTEEEKVYEIWKQGEKSMSKLVDSVVKMILPYGMRLISEIKLSSGCQSSIMRWIFDLRKLKMSAVELLDAFGKPFPGIFYGTISMYGNYEQCLNTVSKNEKSGKEYFKGQYCSISLKPALPPKPDKIVLQKVMPIFKDFVEEKDTVVRFIASYAHLMYNLSLRYDICIPDKCTKEDISLVVDYMQEGTDFIKINLDWCEVYTEEKLDIVHHVCSYSIAAVGLIVLIATLWHWLMMSECFKIKTAADKYVKAFSIMSSLKSLTKSNHEKLSALQGIRFISCVLLILIYSLFNFDLDIFSGLLNILSLPNYTPAELLLHASLYIDSFFLLSGIMVMFSNLPRDKQHEGKFYVLSYLGRRLFRIIPTYLFLMACIIVLPNAGSGPLWNQTVKKDAQLCREHWWKNLLFINNFIVSANNMCLHNSWYVANDMQLYSFALIILSLLIVWRAKHWAILTGVVISLAGMISVGFITYFNDYNATLLLSNFDFTKIYNYMDIIYHLPHDHIACYCAGLALGYLFVNKPEVKLSIPVQILGWTISTGLWSSILFGIDPWNRGDLPEVLLSSIFAATHRLAFCIGIGWIVFVCYYGYGGFINSILSNPIFAVASKLSYAVFLGYSITYNMVFGFFRFHVYVSRVEFIFFLIAYVVTLYAVAFVVYLIIDGPVISLKKILFYHPLLECNTSVFKNDIKIIPNNEKISKFDTLNSRRSFNMDTKRCNQLAETSSMYNCKL
ncbi:nose resistant to fluoxetine protein 6-like [Centruroides vittatus]|uniref:nose resistant to fluoxetine protein 6-like n=1 Tax=Centruroides vittatus TaxID=120091 RepID=UPI00350FD7C2